MRAGGICAKKGDEVSDFLAITRDLTTMARDGDLPTKADPKDFRYPPLLQALLGEAHRNVLIIGPPGCGKTRFVHGLVHAGLDVSWYCPHSVIELQWNVVRAEAADVTPAMKQMVAFLRKAPHVILFIDGITPMMDGRIGNDNVTHVAQTLWPAVRHREIRCVGTMKTAQYEHLLSTNPAALESFQTLHLNGWSRLDVLEALLRACPQLEAQYSVRITDAAVNASLVLGNRYMKASFPQSSFSLLREACKRYDVVRAALNRVSAFVDPSAAARQNGHVGVSHVASAIEAQGRINIEALAQQWANAVMVKLQRRVVGQDGAITALANAFVNVSLGAVRPFGPAGVLAFVGPPSVGKATLARTLARRVLENGYYFQWDFDLKTASENPQRIFDPENAAAVAGRTCSDDEDITTVVLVRGLETAPESLQCKMNLLFRSGWLQLNDDSEVNCKNVLFIVTTDLDTAGYEETRRIQLLRKPLEARFGRELAETFDHVIPFDPLEGPALLRIARHAISEAANALPVEDLRIDPTPEACQLAVDAGYKPLSGVNSILEWVREQVRVPLREWIARGQVPAGAMLRIDAEGDHLQFNWSRTDSEGALPRAEHGLDD